MANPEQLLYIYYILHIPARPSMIRSTLSTAVLLLVLPSLAFAQNSSRTVERIEQKGNRLEVVTNDGVYLLTPYSDRIMETVFVPKGEALDPRSHAVVMTPKAAGSLTTSGGAARFATAGISATVTRAPPPYKASSGVSAKSIDSALPRRV